MSSVNEEIEAGSVEHQATAAAEAPGESGASVDKIRDIIFGSQIKNYEARFVRLEQDLVRETAELKELMRKRFESIESFFKTESDAMAARLRAEKEERSAHVAKVERETKEAHGGLANHVNNVETAMNEGHSALRQELMTESRKLLEEIDQRYDSIRSLMDARVLELRTQKVDRGHLSDLFRVIAAHLNDKDQNAASE
jgi:predicted oxidoreductase